MTSIIYKGLEPVQRKKTIDVDELKKLLHMQCTDSEIAAWFGVSLRTIANLKKREGFKDIFTHGSNQGKISLKRAQFRAALDGNTALLIFLGKQYLGQSDKTVTEHTGKDGKPIESVITTKTKNILEKLSDEQLKQLERIANQVTEPDNPNPTLN